MTETNTKKKIKKEGTLAKHKSDISKMKLSQRRVFVSFRRLHIFDEFSMSFR